MAKVTPINPDQIIVPPIDSFASWERSTYSIGSGPALRYNPDLLVRKHGLGIFHQMRSDDQVKAAMQFKKQAILGRGYTLEFKDEDGLTPDQQQERIQIISELLESMDETSIEDGLTAMLTGFDYGFSITEKVLTNVVVDGTQYIGLKGLYGRSPLTFQFETDAYGQLISFWQTVNGMKQELDITRFIHYVHNPEFDRYFGRSDLREAYRPWYIKQRLDDLWVLYLERFAGGFLTISRDGADAPAVGSPEYVSLQTVLQNMHSASGIILPKGVKAEMMFPPNNSQFEEAVATKDLAIARSLLIPNLLGLSHTGSTGAYSQSQTQIETFLWTLYNDTRRVEATIDRQLIHMLVDYNFGDEIYPCFKFKPASVEHLNFIIARWAELAGADAAITTEADESYLRRLLDMPQRKPDDQPIAAVLAKLVPQAAAPGSNAPVPPDAKRGGGSELQDQVRYDATSNRLTAIEESLASLNAATKQSILDAVRFAFDPDEARDDHGKWVAGGGNLTAHEKSVLDTLRSGIEGHIATHSDGSKWAQVLVENGKPEGMSGKTYSAILSNLRSKGLYLQEKGRGQNPYGHVRMVREEANKHANLPPPHTKLRSASRAQFDRAVQRVMFSVIETRQQKASDAVADEVAGQVARATKRLMGTDDNLKTITSNSPQDVASVELSSSEKQRINTSFRRALGSAWTLGQQTAHSELNRAYGQPKMKTTLTDIRDNAAQYFETNSFRMAGNVSDAVRAMIQQELQNSIKFGRSPQQTREVIWGRLVDKGLTSRTWVRQTEDDDATVRALNELWLDSESQAASYLDTLARTNMFEAMNEARFAEFTDPALDGFVTALEYSAILDDRTTEICSELDGSIWADDSPNWDNYRPPNHYNCRSLLVPITQADGWDGQESPEPSIQPQAGFGGGGAGS